MRNLSASLAIAACAFVWTASAAAPARAADPAPQPPTAPELVPAAVAAAVNQLSPEASPCELMTRDLREYVAAHELLTHDPAVSEPWAPADVTRLCDAYVLRETGMGSGASPDRGGWVRTEVGPARAVQARDDAVHLRARVTQRHRPANSPFGGEEIVDLFVVLEEGTWRLASPEQLLELMLAAGRPSKTLAEFDRDRAEQQALTRRLLRAHARMVRELASVPRPGPDPRESGESDPGRGSIHRLEGSFSRVRDPRAARVDLVDARLSTGRGRMCWTVRLRAPAADRLDLSFLLAQGSASDEEARVSQWSLRLDGGRAVGLLAVRYGMVRTFALRASVRGRVVRVVVPAWRVRERVRVGERFGWSVSSFMPDPDRPPGSTTAWADSLPQLRTWDDLAGIRHRR
jgi:hypothetical protein